MPISADDLVRREVFHCVSALVSTLARGVQDCERSGELMDTCEQAQELCYPVDDYEEAAIQAGWSRNVSRMAGTVSYQHRDHGTVICDGWQELCEDYDIEPYQREVFEHWLVSEWLGRKLEERGERVDFDFQGLVVWARTTSGQGIAQDYVIEQIVDELNKA